MIVVVKGFLGQILAERLVSWSFMRLHQLLDFYPMGTVMHYECRRSKGRVGIVGKFIIAKYKRLLTAPVPDHGDAPDRI